MFKVNQKTPEQRHDLDIEETKFFNFVNFQLNRRKKNTVNIYLFKVDKRNSIKNCEICSKFTIKTPERRHCLVIQEEIFGEYTDHNVPSNLQEIFDISPLPLFYK